MEYVGSPRDDIQYVYYEYHFDGLKGQYIYKNIVSDVVNSYNLIPYRPI